jgi:glycosyltransferase involved in cell wall biosynthesis
MITGAFVDFFKKNPKTNLRLVFACRIKNQADKRKKKEVQMRFFYSGFLDYVIFTDSITDMSSLYNSSDIIIFPVKNLKGKFDVPLVIIESYACGKPVILSDLEQFGEFANRDICVSIPKDSEIKLIESVTYLKENEAERVRLGENARRFVKDHFDLQNTAKQYEKIYAKI